MRIRASWRPRRRITTVRRPGPAATFRLAGGTRVIISSSLPYTNSKLQAPSSRPRQKSVSELDWSLHLDLELGLWRHAHPCVAPQRGGRQMLSFASVSNLSFSRALVLARRWASLLRLVLVVQDHCTGRTSALHAGVDILISSGRPFTSRPLVRRRPHRVCADQRDSGGDPFWLGTAERSGTA